MAKYSCPKCSSLRKTSKQTQLSDNSVEIEIRYECGSSLTLEMPWGKYHWIHKCKVPESQ